MRILAGIFALLIATSSFADIRNTSDISPVLSPENVLKHMAAEKVIKECIDNTLKRSKDVYDLVLQGGPDAGLTINIIKVTCYAESLRRNDGLISAPTDVATPKPGSPE